MALEIRIKRAEEYSARQLAAEMLADAVGSAPEDIFFYRGENGKPLTNLSLHFNCSHSGGFVVCAVGEREAPSRIVNDMKNRKAGNSFFMLF